MKNIHWQVHVFAFYLLKLVNYRWWTSYRCKGRCNVNVDKHKLFSPKTRWLTHVLQSLVYIYILFTSTSIVKQCTQFNVSSGSCLIKNMSPASNDVFIGITVIQYVHCIEICNGNYWRFQSYCIYFANTTLI